MDPKRTKKEKEKADFEIAFFEAILKEKPDFIEALAALGDLYTKNGFCEKGLCVDKKLSQLRPNDPVVLYNLACSYSLLSDLDHAFAAIEQAVRCGYSDFNYIEYDNDLHNLRADARFQQFLTGVKTKKTADGQSVQHG